MTEDMERTAVDANAPTEPLVTFIAGKDFWVHSLDGETFDPPKVIKAGRYADHGNGFVRVGDAPQSSTANLNEINGMT